MKEPGLVQLVAFAELVSANAQSLRRVDGRFRVEDERPFRGRRGLANRGFAFGSSSAPLAAAARRRGPRSA